jgi:hypothetical protein
MNTTGIGKPSTPTTDSSKIPSDNGEHKLGQYAALLSNLPVQPFSEPTQAIIKSKKQMKSEKYRHPATNPERVEHALRLPKNCNTKIAIPSISQHGISLYRLDSHTFGILHPLVVSGGYRPSYVAYVQEKMNHTSFVKSSLRL